MERKRECKKMSEIMARLNTMDLVILAALLGAWIAWLGSNVFQLVRYEMRRRDHDG